MTRKTAFGVAYGAAVWSVIALISFPLLWMIVTSIRPKPETYAYPPRFWPTEITFVHYQRLFTETPFLGYLRNSLIVSGASTVLVTIIGLLGAYGLVWFRFRGRTLMGQAILFTYLLPSTVLIVPLYLIIAKAGLANSLAGLVVVYTTFALPFALWLMRSFLAAMPAELEQAARIDGASRIEAFIDVIVPLALPGIISTALFTFISAWNEYLYALVFINDDDLKTLPPGVTHLFRTTYDIEWNLLMAASVVIILPVIAVFSYLQSYLTAGFGAGAVKG